MRAGQVCPEFLETHGRARAGSHMRVVLLKPYIDPGRLSIGTDHLGRWLTVLFFHLGDCAPQLRHVFAGASGKLVKETSFCTH